MTANGNLAVNYLKLWAEIIIPIQLAQHFVTVSCIFKVRLYKPYSQNQPELCCLCCQYRRRACTLTKIGNFLKEECSFIPIHSLHPYAFFPLWLSFLFHFSWDTASLSSKFQCFFFFFLFILSYFWFQGFIFYIKNSTIFINNDSLEVQHMVEKVTDNFLYVFTFLTHHSLRFKNNKSVFPGILRVMTF